MTIKVAGIPQMHTRYLDLAVIRCFFPGLLAVRRVKGQWIAGREKAVKRSLAASYAL